MAVWKVQRLGRVSSLTGEPFPPDSEIVTALFGEDEEMGEDRVRGSGFLRKDYLDAEATEERLAGSFCRWRTRTPPAKAEEEKRFDLGMAKEFLQRLLAEGRDDRAPVCLTLALLLARKRRLVIEDQDAESLTCRWTGEKGTFPVPAPVVSEAEAEVLQQDIMRLFGFETAPEPAPEPAAEDSAEGGEAVAAASDSPEDASAATADADPETRADAGAPRD
ncbi:MAG: hypothetical protein P1V36_10130 [Planctomycetota bacterium]|nr:hypothetical protein [Planctomycetota bacterium]